MPLRAAADGGANAPMPEPRPGAGIARDTLSSSTEQLADHAAATEVAAQRNGAAPSTPGNDVPVIQFEGVHKIYDLGEIQVHALRGLDVTIRRGEFVAIMGASG